MKRIIIFTIFQLLFISSFAQSRQDKFKNYEISEDDIFWGYEDVLPYIKYAHANKEDKELIKSLMKAAARNMGGAGRNDAKEIYNKALILSKKGYAIGDYWIGWCYEGAEGVPLDLKKSHEYFYKAATHKIPFNWAYRNLGLSYFEGYLGDVDFQKALYWYDKACQEINYKGHKGQSYCAKGIIYQGEGNVPKNEFEEYKNFKASAELDWPWGKEKFGMLLLTSEKYGNKKEAIYWIAKAANDNMANSQFCYGYLLLQDGKESEGIKYIRKAAEQGVYPAMQLLDEYQDIHNNR